MFRTVQLFCDTDTSTSSSKTRKRLKERALIRRNRTKRANFRESPLFQATYNVKKIKKIKKIIQLILCQLDVGDWRSLVPFFLSASHSQLTRGKLN